MRLRGPITPRIPRSCCCSTQGVSAASLITSSHRGKARSALTLCGALRYEGETEVNPKCTRSGRRVVHPPCATSTRSGWRIGRVR